MKQKRLAKTAPVPCIVRDAKSTILAKNNSLAENMQRAALKPLDQFRAFVALREKSTGDEEIAAGFFVAPQVVKQRLKLAAVAPALLYRLVSERLQAAAEAIAAVGWKWIEVLLDLPYGYSHGLRRLNGDPAPMTDDEGAAHAKLLAEYRALEEEYDGQDEFPEEIDARLSELEVAMVKLEARPLIFDAKEIARARAFVTLDRYGELAVNRGFVRPEDEPRADADLYSGEQAVDGQGAELSVGSSTDGIGHGTVIKSAGQALGANMPDDENDRALKPLPSGWSWS